MRVFYFPPFFYFGRSQSKPTGRAPARAAIGIAPAAITIAARSTATMAALVIGPTATTFIITALAAQFAASVLTVAILKTATITTLITARPRARAVIERNMTGIVLMEVAPMKF